MNPQVKKLWIEALRSGKYEASYDNVLRTKNNKYCIFGVLLDVIDNSRWKNVKKLCYSYDFNGQLFSVTAPPKILLMVNLNSDIMWRLIHIYNKKVSFNEMALIIERNF